MQVKYTGPFDGVEIPTPDEIPRARFVERGCVVDVPDWIAETLVRQQPDEFEVVKPAKKKAAEAVEGGED